jgi:large subunit ribosomal protein L33
MRVNVTLACTECGDRNYITTKNKRNNPERVGETSYFEISPFLLLI